MLPLVHMVVTFIAVLCVFALIGLWSVRQSQGTAEDYLIASRNVKPWLAALSAVATNNSGYMFIGLIGYAYSTGLSALWMMAGWVSGDLAASFLLNRKLRRVAGERQALSYNELLSRWHDGTDFTLVRRIGGFLTLIFLSTYAAAQLKAGDKALHVLLGWDYGTGTVIGAVLVVLYCFAGGIRASIWTDAAQSFVMIFSIVALFAMCVVDVGGIDAWWAALDGVSEHYRDALPQDLPFGQFFGGILFIMGWFCAGFGVAGQPHIMVRYMTLRHENDVKTVRYYYYSWFLLFFTLCIGVGLSARLLLPAGTDFDAELAMPMLAMHMFPDVMVGIILAGLFAATMSTADSQILSCTAAVTRDLAPSFFTTLKRTKGTTLSVVALVLLIALFSEKSVFALVLLSWSALGASFTPLLCIYALGGKPSHRDAVLVMLAGLVVSVLWQQSGYGEMIYEILPGIAAGFAMYGLTRLLPCSA